MRTLRFKAVVISAVAVAGLLLCGVAGASASRSASTDGNSSKPAAATAEPAQRPPAEPAHPAAPTPSIKETLAAVTQISHDLKLIEARLASLDRSLAGINASVAPLRDLAQPAALRGLILLASACGAGLIVLHAALRRWAGPRR